MNRSLISSSIEILQIFIGTQDTLSHSCFICLIFLAQYYRIEILSTFIKFDSAIVIISLHRILFIGHGIAYKRR